MPFAQSGCWYAISSAWSHLIVSKSLFHHRWFYKQCLIKIVTEAERDCPEKTKAFKDTALTRTIIAKVGRYLLSHQFPEIKQSVARIMDIFGNTNICKPFFFPNEK